MKELIKKFIPDFLLGFYHYSLVLISAFLYGFPSRKMTIIGVTGTSGKSTVVELTARIFEEALRQRLRLSGSAERPQGKQFKIASLSSIKFKIGDKEWENRLKMTMPGRMKLQRFLRQAVKVGCEYVVLEVTSEGIKQFRHKFIDFDVAVLTNLSPEHIEAHGGFKKYRKAKAKLFQQTKNEESGRIREYSVGISGSKYVPPYAIELDILLKEFFEWFNQNKNKLHPVHFAALVHLKFVTIHPFGDGNGRISRLLMNYALNKNNYPMLIINYSDRNSYYNALERSQLSESEDIFTLWFFKRYIKEYKKYEK